MIRVCYHGLRWMELVEQGWVTAYVVAPNIAVMVRP